MSFLEALLQSLPLQPLPLTHPQLHARASTSSPEDIPVKHAIHYRDDWAEPRARRASHIFTYRDNDGPGRFRMSYKLRDSTNTFWTSLRLSWDRNVPAKWRMYIWFSEDFEYELMPWQDILNATWTYLPNPMPAFFISPGKIYIDINIPDEPSPGCPINVNLSLCGFENLFPWAPRWDMKDTNGNRLLTWIPARDSGNTNDADLYHCLYDSEPPFEPNCETLPLAPSHGLNP